MRHSNLLLFLALLALVCASAHLAAQPSGQPTTPPDQQASQDQDYPVPDRFARREKRGEWDDEWYGPGPMRRDLPYGRQWRRPSSSDVMASGMMGPWTGGSGMVRMMLIMMDTDANGAVSLQEFQAGHERVFKAMDVNKDGSLTLEEVQRFGRFLRGPD
jgi:hypothetical protein